MAVYLGKEKVGITIKGDYKGNDINCMKSIALIKLGMDGENTLKSNEEYNTEYERLRTLMKLHMYGGSSV